MIMRQGVVMRPSGLTDGRPGDFETMTAAPPSPSWESEWFAATEAGLGWAAAQDFEQALTNFFIYKLTQPFQFDFLTFPY